VDFVDVIDLEPGAARPEPGVLPQLADLLDAVVAGPVDLDDVDVLADGDRLADVAGLVRIALRRAWTTWSWPTTSSNRWGR